ncbi:MAG: HXXEE domain-containing protein [Clostridiales bacterium]|nr:HXXEE domain-containing protein [Clostridiales bacterium]
MKFWRRYWYWIGGVLFVVLAFIMGLWGSEHLPKIQTILIFSWMAMLVHQVEEYGFPGGMPSITNMAAFREKEAPERYPFNAQQCFICNVFLCYAFYILAICFPNVIWLGASQVLGVLVQLAAHGLLVNFSMKDFYNPGLGSTVFLQLPVAVYYIWYVCTTMPEKAWQLWVGVPGAIIAMLICFIAPVLLMRNRKNPYPFAEEEMYGYKKEKVLEIWRDSKPSLLQRVGLK